VVAALSGADYALEALEDGGIGVEGVAGGTRAVDGEIVDQIVDLEV
jgi:hypothetical protein